MEVLLLILGIGLWLTALGLRGRRVGDHPYCRRCGFDLVARPAESHACPECGADLRDPTGTVTGQLHARKRLVAVGLLLAVPTFVVVAAWFVGDQRGVNWQEQKPNWWLISETNGGGVRSVEARQTLIRRYLKGGSSRGQAQQLVRHVLAIQADRNRDWSDDWARIIERARTRDDITDEQWRTYVEQALTDFVVLQVRPRVRAGDPLPYLLKDNTARTTFVGRDCVVRVIAVNIDGQEQFVDDVTYRPAFYGEANDMPGVALPARNTPGHHKGWLEVELACIPSAYPGIWPAATQPQKYADRFIAATQRANFSVRRRLPFEFVVTPATQPALEPVRDDRLVTRVADALSGVNAVAFQTTGEFHVQVYGEPLPVGLSFEVIARDGPRRWPLAHLACPAGRNIVLQTTAIPIPNPRPRTIDLIFRPDPTPAIRTLDIFSAWDREVVVPHVAVIDPNLPPPPPVKARPASSAASQPS